jgi:tetratricopeptide (TPR) repeat protein
VPSAEWEAGTARLWERLDELPDDEFVAAIDARAAELPDDDGAAPFERACARDSTGDPAGAVPLYRLALQTGLTGERRRRAVVQLASSLRNTGAVEESVRLLRAELEQPDDPLTDAVRAFLALALVDAGREREAVSLALGALAPHLPRYQRSLAQYARALTEDPREA